MFPVWSRPHRMVHRDHQKRNIEGVAWTLTTGRQGYLRLEANGTADGQTDGKQRMRLGEVSMTVNARDAGYFPLLIRVYPVGSNS